jgi:hypothetical protein
MSETDHDILRSANLWLNRHGDDAVTEARKMVASLQEAGDRDSADVWLRVLLAVENMRGSAYAA